MARLFLTPIDLNKLELLNARLQQLAADPGSPVTGQVYYNTAANTVRFYNGTAWIDLGRLDQISNPTASRAMNSQKITGLLDPTDAQDAATKAYVDALIQGLAWKDSVRAATIAAGTLATSFENGDTIDGVALATGDRILIKDQGTPAENGIYVVQASGAPVRATDADTGAEIVGAAVFVQEGSLADTAWVLQTNAPITLGSTSLTFAQFGAGTAYTEGNGIDITGSVISVDAPLSVLYGGLGVASPTDHAVLVGSGAAAVTPIAVGASGQVLRGVTGADPAFGAVNLTTDVTGDLPVADGGTGAGTAAGAKTNLGFMTRFAQSYGDGSALSYNIDHNLGSLDVLVQVYRKSDGVEVEVDVTRSTTNRVIVAHAVAPTSNQYRVVVIG
jgi:hypothetical protein